MNTVCRIESCPCVTAPGSDYCTVHRDYKEIGPGTDVKCATCQTKIRVGTYRG